jgi:catalase
MKLNPMVNYEPNSVVGAPTYVEDRSKAAKAYPVTGKVERLAFVPGDIDFEQPRAFWGKVFTEW